MSPWEYEALAELVSKNFTRVYAWFDRLEDRVTRVEVGLEGLRDDLRQVAEAVVANGDRIDRNGERIERNGERIDQNRARIDRLEIRLGSA